MVKLVGAYCCWRHSLEGITALKLTIIAAVMNHHSCCDVCMFKCSCSTPCAYRPQPAEEARQQTNVDDGGGLTPVRTPTINSFRNLCVLREQKVDTLYAGNDIASGFPTYISCSVYI